MCNKKPTEIYEEFPCYRANLPNGELTDVLIKGRDGDTGGRVQCIYSGVIFWIPALEYDNLRQIGMVERKYTFRMVDDYELDQERRCVYRQAWVGRCEEHPVRGTDHCKTHSDKRCGCGRMATHNCEQTMGPFVCGRELCDQCRCNH